ncbi:Mitochondrial carrier protein-Rim2p/Mrs12p [Ceraceosorus bombacis]|uniref:Mitochondrial carrier protein-Rim2p/Mrs12p n=1 Tax=Ceraceosorus bombacis TaxID=401625 RepID=A0A0P1BET0_9BASI|nr:Mitochondrial carrier protein-Rim2p/Mrs12p [Ceraceosorus bombacis]
MSAEAGPSRRPAVAEGATSLLASPPSSETQTSTAFNADASRSIAHRSADRTENSLRSVRKAAAPPAWLHFAAGGAGGMCGAIVTSPLDVVKTRLQSDLYRTKAHNIVGSSTTAAGGVVAQGRKLAYHFVETGHILAEIWTKEGPRALFRGLGPTLVGAVPARAINFWTYGNGKALIAEHLNDGKETAAVHLAAAANAGMVTATATNPIWVVKTRLQLEAHAQDAEHASQKKAAVTPSSASKASVRGLQQASSPATFSTASSSRSVAAPLSKVYFKSTPAPKMKGATSLQMTLRIIKEEGIRGMYRGMSASYLGVAEGTIQGMSASYLGVAEGTIQWVLYERIKRWKPAGERGTELSTKNSRWSSTIGAAGVAKLTASLITYPHEVLRTRLRQQPPAGTSQPKYTGLKQTLMLVLKEEGAAALYGGLSAHLLRVVPNAVIMFSVYELALHLGSGSDAAQQQVTSGAADHARIDAERKV